MPIYLYSDPVRLLWHHLSYTVTTYSVASRSVRLSTTRLVVNSVHSVILMSHSRGLNPLPCYPTTLLHAITIETVCPYPQGNRIFSRLNLSRHTCTDCFVNTVSTIQSVTSTRPLSTSTPIGSYSLSSMSVALQALQMFHSFASCCDEYQTGLVFAIMVTPNIQMVPLPSDGSGA